MNIILLNPDILTATVHALADVPLPYTQFGRNPLPQLQGVLGDPDRAVFA